MTRPSDEAYVIEQQRSAIEAKRKLADEEYARLYRQRTAIDDRMEELRAFMNKARELITAQTAMAAWLRGTDDDN